MSDCRSSKPILYLEYLQIYVAYDLTSHETTSNVVLESTRTSRDRKISRKFSAIGTRSKLNFVQREIPTIDMVSSLGLAYVVALFFDKMWSCPQKGEKRYLLLRRLLVVCLFCSYANNTLLNEMLGGDAT